MADRNIARFDPSAALTDIVGAVTRDGCAVIEGLADNHVMDAIEQEMAPHIAETPKGDGTIMGFETKRTSGLMGKSPAAGTLATQPLVLGVVDSILGPFCDRFQILSTTTIAIGPGETVQPLHRDDGMYPFRHPNPRECIVATLWAMSDFTDENGATRMILDSHHWNDERQPTQEETIPVEMSRGSVSVYLGSVYHGGGANRSDAVRTGMYIGYCLGWLRQEENQYLAVPPEVARTLPRQLQELVGYSIHRPFLGWCEHRDPEYLLAGEGSADGPRPDTIHEGVSTVDQGPDVRRV
ncbi:MAG: phytanoyl-CoA dioxygenase family protein [bacterium]|nr:phytanoyl-CoA dioxygenase family protein [bacterium]